MSAECTNTHPKKGSQKSKKAAFLQAVGKGSSVAFASQAAGIHRRTVYLWRDQDEDFAAAWNEAKESGADWYEDRLRDQAADGNVTAIIIGLKMKKRFVEKQEVEHSGKDGAPPITQVVIVKDYGRPA